MKKYYYKKTLIAIRINSFPKGSIPHTDPEASLGFLSLNHPKGGYLKAHMHEAKKRVTNGRLQECFIIVKGKVRVDLFGPDKKLFKKIFLRPGQILITMNGGHGFKILEDSLIFEVKHGPYIDDKTFI